MSNGIKVVYLFLYSKLRTNSDVQNYVTNRQKNRQDRQKKDSTSPTELDMVIEDLEHVLAPLKHWGSDAQLRRKGMLKIWGKPDLLNLKPP